MKLKGITDVDIVNYKKTSMYLAFPTCDFKCEREYPGCCQNNTLISSPDIEIELDELCQRYINNPLTHAMVCGGLEPFDSFETLLELVYCLREKYMCDDDVVIYTGYTEDECRNNGWIDTLGRYNNIIIKVGRFHANDKSHTDNILGIKLASTNQYAIRLADHQEGCRNENYPESK